MLTLVCVFYLSFSFVTRHYTSKAKEFAKGDVKVEQDYLDSLANEKVYFGNWTLKQCREMEISLGLDLKGGMNVILEVSVPDVIKVLADNKTDEAFNQALATAANRHMIDANAIAKMKNGVVLINTARGTLIDPEALINGLESGKIGAAGLDVVENENGLFYFNHMGDALQNRELAMLRSFPNVIFTPHTAFYTDVNVASMVESAFKAVRAMADGEQTPLEVRL